MATLFFLSPIKLFNSKRIEISLDFFYIFKVFYIRVRSPIYSWISKKKVSLDFFSYWLEIDKIKTRYIISIPYRNTILHISNNAAKLREVQLGGEGQRVREVTGSTSSCDTLVLQFTVVWDDGGMVFACCYSLEQISKNKLILKT